MNSEGIGEYTESITVAPIEGTIIDVETDYSQNPICFGSLHGNKLSIIYITELEPDTGNLFIQAIDDEFKELSRPFLAFRATFDQEIISSFLGHPIPFDGDLHILHQSKDKTARKLGAPIISDPLKGRSKDVPRLWDKYLRTKQQHLLDRIIKHNRACLLKETYIAQQAGWKPISEYSLKEKERNINMEPQDATTQQILQSLKERTVVEITYLNNKNSKTKREVAVLSLGHQYFHGYCFLCNEIRTFRTACVTNISFTQIQIEGTHLFWQNLKG